MTRIAITALMVLALQSLNPATKTAATTAVRCYRVKVLTPDAGEWKLGLTYEAYCNELSVSTNGDGELKMAGFEGTMYTTKFARPTPCRPSEPQCSDAHEMWLQIRFDPNISQLELYQQGRQTDVLQRSLTQPQAVIVSPSSGQDLELNSSAISWFVSNGDSPSRVVSVSLSKDSGRTWQLLSFEPRGNSLAFPPKSEMQCLPSCELELVASSGLRTVTTRTRSLQIVGRRQFVPMVRANH